MLSDDVLWGMTAGEVEWEELAESLDQWTFKAKEEDRFKTMREDHANKMREFMTIK